MQPVTEEQTARQLLRFPEEPELCIMHGIPFPSSPPFLHQVYPPAHTASLLPMQTIAPLLQAQPLVSLRSLPYLRQAQPSAVTVEITVAQQLPLRGAQES